MTQIRNRLTTLLTIFILGLCGTALAQDSRLASGVCAANSALNGVYRIDVDRSDKLFSVIEGASSTVPNGEQQDRKSVV